MKTQIMGYVYDSLDEKPEDNIDFIKRMMIMAYEQSKELKIQEPAEEAPVAAAPASADDDEFIITKKKKANK